MSYTLVPERYIPISESPYAFGMLTELRKRGTLPLRRADLMRRVLSLRSVSERLGQIVSVWLDGADTGYGWLSVIGSLIATDEKCATGVHLDSAAVITGTPAEARQVLVQASELAGPDGTVGTSLSFVRLALQSDPGEGGGTLLRVNPGESYARMENGALLVDATAGDTPLMWCGPSDRATVRRRTPELDEERPRDFPSGTNVRPAQLTTPPVAMKYDGEKPRLDLLPPLGVLAAARAMTYGEKKYSAWNYRAGDMKLSRLHAAAHRHLLAWQLGEAVDADSGLSHLDHLAACALMLADLAESGLGVDDRPGTGSE